MNTIGYDFQDTFLPCGELRVAVRLSTVSNIYNPLPIRTEMKTDEAGATLTCSKLSGAGGQLEAEGSLTLTVRREGGRYRIAASGKHPSEACVAIVLLIKGIPADFAASESPNMGEREFRDGHGIDAFHYPGRDATMPLAFFRTPVGDEWFALSKDDRVRQKSFAAYEDPKDGERVLVLAHREDRRIRGNDIVMPEWHVGRSDDRAAIAKERCDDLEANLGAIPFALDESANWLEDVRAVVNFHGEHWTGHLFHTFDEMCEQVRWLCRRIDGKHLLAFLPAWDGRYYCTYPEHRPSARMGGAEGLKRFVDVAHSLGVKVVPMLGGPNLATFEFLAKHGIEEAALKTETGFPLLQDWVDWNGDLTKEHMGYIVNFGHPGFRRAMLETAYRLLDEFGFDGLFLDGAIRWSNAPDYSPYEGIVDWAREVKRRYPDKLLMAEDGYDALWSHFRLFATSWGPVGLGDALLRYSRQTEYLAYPAENGSSGIHEAGYGWPRMDRADRRKTIPTLALFGDSLVRHGDEIERKLEEYSAWRLETGGHGESFAGGNGS